MARWKTFNEVKDILGRTVNLSRAQWSIVILILAIPILAIVNSAFGLNYQAQANQSDISSNEQVIDELSQQNEQMNKTIKAQAAVIAKQKKNINALKSDNDTLSNSLTATEAELAEKEDKKKDKQKKKKDCDNNGWYWSCSDD